VATGNGSESPIAGIHPARVWAGLLSVGLDISYESVRSWVLKFGPAIGRGLRRTVSTERSLASHENGRPDRGQALYLWRAVDHEARSSTILVQRRRDRSAARKAGCASCSASRASRRRGDD